MAGINVATMGSAPAEENTASPALRWYVLFVMMLAYTINIADRYVMSTVLEEIRLELHLTDGGVAFLTGVSLALFYVGMGFPLAWITDRYSRRNVLAVSLAVWSLMTTMCGFARSYTQLLLARIGVGIGEAGGSPACTSLVCDFFPAARRPMALTIFCLGAPLGAWLGADVAGAAAHAYGWRGAFLVLGVPGVLLALVVLFTIREPKRGCLDKISPEETPSVMETLRFIFSQKAALHVFMANGVTTLWGWGLMWFTPTFLQRSYHLDVGQAGSLVGQIYLIAGVAASLLTAWMLARPFFVDPRRILYLLAGINAIATIPSIIAYSTDSLPVTTLCLWLFIPAVYMILGPQWALTQNLSPPKMRAMFSVVGLLIANVFNLIVAPQGVGLLSDYFAGPGGADAASLRTALMFLAPTGFWAAIHYVLAARTIVADQRRAIGGA
ncbi:MFS transporter [Sphingomonas profundi]|uniref:MFS transporter n=1 Tax=Alterirhizorhabdus profundi TaxID=2681549 RepID=UPI001E3C848F|nr:MFS transporter [Sphingomonas profundi]